LGQGIESGLPCRWEEKEEEEEVSDLCFFPPDNTMPDMRHFKAFAQGMLLLRSHVEVGEI
jgi:hypothetical protein